MKTAVITFGRMNPPTSGHQKLVDKLRTVARLEKGDPLVFLSHSQDAKKNPLDYNSKLKFAQKAFGRIVQRSSANTIIKVLQELDKKYDRVVLVVGSDRVEDFRSMLEKYNGKDYTFEEIEVVSAGERDPDADDVSGMSASKMRKLATDDDFEGFKQGLPSMLQKDAKKVYNELRLSMKISESIVIAEEGNTFEANIKQFQDKIKYKLVSNPPLKKIWDELQKTGKINKDTIRKSDDAIGLKSASGGKNVEKCVMTRFRTVNMLMMDLDKRTGSKLATSKNNPNKGIGAFEFHQYGIHIEHSIPVNLKVKILEQKYAKGIIKNFEEFMNLYEKLSVGVAMTRYEEKSGLSSSKFSSTHPDIIGDLGELDINKIKPFSRYTKNIVIYDMTTGKRVDNSVTLDKLY